jgi:hypothetical protein
MEPLRGTEHGDWLRQRVGAWASVGGVAGTGFDAYARILHPVDAWQEDLTVTDEWGAHPVVQRRRWMWSEVARRNQRVMHPLVQWFSLTDDEDRRDFPDGWHVGQSVDGQLPADLLAVLSGLLRRATTTPDRLIAGVWNGWSELHPESGAVMLLFSDDTDPAEQERERARAEKAWREERRRSVAPAVGELLEVGPLFAWPGREFVLLETSVGELADASWPQHAGIGGVMPQLLWPADHAWVVASEIDWDSTIVAGPRTLIDAVLACDAWEGFEVDENSDLTWDGDTVNPRPQGRMEP